MIDNRDFVLLYMEPAEQKSEKPIIDELTRKMTAAYRDSFSGLVYNSYKYPKYGEGVKEPLLHQAVTLGWHDCICGARRDNAEHL